MTKIMIELDIDELRDQMINDLKESYIDQVKHWSKEPDAEKLADALLTVIEYYSAPSEFNEWYETIKEL